MTSNMEPIKKTIESYQMDQSPPTQSGASNTEMESAHFDGKNVDMSDRLRMYTTVYFAVGERYELDLLGLIFVSTIYSLSKRYGYCDASTATLSKFLRVTDPTTISKRKELTSCGLIEKMEEKGRNGTNRLRVSAQVEDYIEYIQGQISSKRMHSKEKRSGSKDI